MPTAYPKENYLGESTASFHGQLAVSRTFDELRPEKLVRILAEKLCQTDLGAVDKAQAAGELTRLCILIEGGNLKSLPEPGTGHCSLVRQGAQPLEVTDLHSAPGTLHEVGLQRLEQDGRRAGER